MEKKILVTGAGGFVAGSVLTQAPDGWEIHALSGKPSALARSNVTWHCLDLLDSRNLESRFREIAPAVAIHTAAVADIDYCESNRETAKKVNVGVTERLAELCEEAHTRMVYLSTDTVFDGERGNYTEEDEPRPINSYGETKVHAEQAVRGVCTAWAIARLSLVVGLPLIGAGNSFLPKMLDSLSEGKPVHVPGNEIRTPIDVLTLGKALLELAVSPHQGIYHLAGNDALSRFEMGKRIARKWGYSEDLIHRKDSGSIPGRAPRPRDASLDNSKVRRTLNTPMLGLEEGLASIRRRAEDESLNRMR